MLAPSGFVGNSLVQKAGKGDLVPGNWISNILATNGAGTWTAALIAAGFIRRTVVGAPYTDTTESAEAIRLALNSPPEGSAFIFHFQNSVAFAHTFAAGQGVETLGAVSAAASRTRTYLVSLLNATPASTFLATTVNANAVISGLTDAQIAALSVGQAVFGTGIGAAAKIVSINVAAKTFTVSVNSTASASNVAVTVTPVVLFHGIGELTL